MSDDAFCTIFFCFVLIYIWIHRSLVGEYILVSGTRSLICSVMIYSLLLYLVEEVEYVLLWFIRYSCIRLKNLNIFCYDLFVTPVSGCRIWICSVMIYSLLLYPVVKVEYVLLWFIRLTPVSGWRIWICSVMIYSLLLYLVVKVEYVLLWFIRLTPVSGWRIWIFSVIIYSFNSFIRLKNLTMFCYDLFVKLLYPVEEFDYFLLWFISLTPVSGWRSWTRSFMI